MLFCQFNLAKRCSFANNLSKGSNVKKLHFLFIIIMVFAATPTFAVKYVAVVETDVDAASGASAELNPAEVREITAELRRQATENLPLDKYNLMTSETVQSMGGAVLEECAEENCVIALGSKIGADFIVRGTISKFQTKFTLAIELYETENGMLVVSSEAVRSANLEDLLEKAAVASANMYKKFTDKQRSAQKPTSEPVAVEPVAVEPVVPEPVAKKPARDRSASNISIAAGALFASDFGGGAKWGGDQVGTPFYGGGAYIAFDFSYAAIFIDYTQGGGTWAAPKNVDPDNLPDMRRSSLNFGAFAKYPNFKYSEKMNLYPIIGASYELAVSGKLEYKNEPEYVFDGSNKDGYAASALSALWVKIGGGADFYITPTAYIRTELLYGVRTANKIEKDGSDETRLGHGLTVKIGAGFKL